MKFLSISIIFLLKFSSIFGASILAIFQDPSYSHEYTYHKVLREIANRGHQLTVFGSHKFDYGSNSNVTQHIFKDAVEIYRKNFNVSYAEQKKLHWMRIMMQYEVRSFFEVARYEFSHPEIQKIIYNSQDYKFDVIITECYFCHLAVLAEIYNCPIIYFAASEAAVANHGLMGNDNNPAIYSDSTRFPYLHGQLSFNERLNSIVYFFILHGIFLSIVYQYYAYRIAMEFPMNVSKSFTEVLGDRLSLMVVNTSPEFGHVRPLMPNSVQVGFFHVEEPKELADGKVKMFLDMSENGVIIMCFGSKIKTRDLGIDNVHKFLNAFNQTTFNVLWKFDEEIETSKIPSNVLMTKWLPLSDALAHPNIKVIIHHGGLLTSYEAIDREVPQIIFPLVYDEGSNAKLLSIRNAAIAMDLDNFSEGDLLTAINDITTPFYKKNVQQLKARAYDKPIKSKDLAIWHIENVIKYKSEMRFNRDPYKIFIQTYFIDVLVSAVVVIISVYFVVKKTVKN